MNKFQNFLNDTLTSLRSKRDNQFIEYGIDKDTTYKNGTFKELPTDLLMTVCYADAYASVLSNYNDICGTVTAESQKKNFNLLKVNVITEEDLEMFIKDGDCTCLDDLDVSKTDFDWDYAQRALVDVDKNDVIMWNDNIHTHIDDEIDNFLDGITYVGDTYSLKEVCMLEVDMKQYTGMRYR